MYGLKLNKISPLKILIAYPYMNKRMDKILQGLEADKVDYRLYLDSGAFTAYNAGKPIRLSDYCQYLDSMPVKPWRYFSLDVYGDPDTSIRNYLAMLEQGLSPVPVFTVGDEISQLDEYYKTTDVVALGGLGLAKSRGGYLKWVTQQNKGRKLHLLGVTTAPLIRSLRPYTCDSSSWISGGRFGTVSVYLFNGRTEIISLDRLRAGKVSKDCLLALRRYGFEWEMLKDREQWRGAKGVARTIGARSWVTLSNDFYNRLGTQLFLACASNEDLREVIQAYKWLNKAKQ